MSEEDFAARVAGLRRSEPGAIAWMFETFRGDMDRCFRHRPPEDRADLVQDVFVTAITRIHSFEGNREVVLRAWLRSIAFHRWHHRWEADQVRQRHAGMPLDLLLEVNPAHTALSDEGADPYLRVVENEIVGGLLARLTPGQAQAVRARIIEGRSIQEIADDWGVSRERVRGLYKRGIARLRGSASARALLQAA